jgi:hypothetical protein
VGSTVTALVFLAGGGVFLRGAFFLTGDLDFALATAFFLGGAGDFDFFAGAFLTAVFFVGAFFAGAWALLFTEVDRPDRVEGMVAWRVET